MKFERSKGSRSETVEELLDMELAEKKGESCNGYKWKPMKNEPRFEGISPEKCRQYTMVLIELQKMREEGRDPGIIQDNRNNRTVDGYKTSYKLCDGVFNESTSEMEYFNHRCINLNDDILFVKENPEDTVPFDTGGHIVVDIGQVTDMFIRDNFLRIAVIRTSGSCHDIEFKKFRGCKFVIAEESPVYKEESGETHECDLFRAVL